MNKYQEALDWLMEGNDSWSIGEKIKRRREELGISQEELAKKLGYQSRSSINKIELDIQKLPRWKFDDFEKALGISIIDLVEADEHIYIEGKGVYKVFDDAVNLPNHIQKHKELLSELHDIYKEKNHKYGDSFTETVNKYGLVASLTRMHDKFSRIENIILNQAEDDEEERLSDSLKDLANYCLMTVMVLENEDD